MVSHKGGVRLLDLELEGEIETLYVRNPGASVNWKVNVLRPQNELRLPEWIQGQIVEVIKRAATRYPKEKTYAELNHGVHSLLVRVDFSLDEEEIMPYEVEESPAGIGISSKICSGFKERLFGLGWPKKTKVLIYPPRRKGGDDYLWTDILDPQSLNDEYLLAPRINDLEAVRGLEKIRRKSVWPVTYREMKSYGSGWLWKEVDDPTPEKLAQLSNEYARSGSPGIVFKGDGSGNKKVRIVLFAKGKKEAKQWLGTTHFGTFKMRTITGEVCEWKPLYLQKFYWPLRVRVNGSNYFGIYRVYTGFDIKASQWKILGGFLNARTSLSIHGASDAIFIPVIP